MKYTYTSVITHDGDRYFARVPDLSGCISSGSTVEEAIDMITDALALTLTFYEDENMEIPAPTPQSKIPHDNDDICTIIRVDTIAYRAATDTRSVRKNVSLPAWMYNLAEKRGLNCSKILQEALMQKLA